MEMASQESILEILKAFASCWMFSALPLSQLYDLETTPSLWRQRMRHHFLHPKCCLSVLNMSSWTDGYSFHGQGTLSYLGDNFEKFTQKDAYYKLGDALSVRVTTGIWNEITFLAGTERSRSKRFTFHMGEKSCQRIHLQESVSV